MKGWERGIEWWQWVTRRNKTDFLKSSGINMNVYIQNTKRDKVRWKNWGGTMSLIMPRWWRKWKLLSVSPLIGTFFSLPIMKLLAMLIEEIQVFTLIISVIFVQHSYIVTRTAFLSKIYKNFYVNSFIYLQGNEMQKIQCTY